MTDTTTPAPDRPRLAYHHTTGTGPTIVFLSGYGSDMTGTKAVTLEAWAESQGRAYLRFDYGGCGRSEGAFEDQTLVDWRDDVIAMLEALADGPAVLVGSSLGGWLMLLVAKARPDLVAALVGIAPAPDFTDWGVTQGKADAAERGPARTRQRLRPRTHHLHPRFLGVGRGEPADVRLDRDPCPVRLIQGQRDKAVPWLRTTRLAELLRSADVQTLLVKDGDHRLSRDSDIALIIRAVEDVIARL